MPLLKLRIKGKMHYIPTREIVEVKEEDSVTTVIYARNGITYRTNDLEAVLRALLSEDAGLTAFWKESDTKKSSLFDLIFGSR